MNPEYIKNSNKFFEIKDDYYHKLAILACTAIFIIMSILISNNLMGFQFTELDENVNIRIIVLISSIISLVILFRTKNIKIIHILLIINIGLILVNNVIRNDILTTPIENLTMFVIILFFLNIVFNFNMIYQMVVSLFYSGIILANIIYFQSDYGVILSNMLIIISVNIISFAIGKMHTKTQTKILQSFNDLQTQIVLYEKNKIEIASLSKLIKICRVCNSVQDEEEYNKIKSYFKNQNKTNLKYSLCPDCTSKNET